MQTLQTGECSVTDSEGTAERGTPRGGARHDNIYGLTSGLFNMSEFLMTRSLRSTRLYTTLQQLAAGRPFNSQSVNRLRLFSPQVTTDTFYIIQVK